MSNQENKNPEKKFIQVSTKKVPFLKLDESSNINPNKNIPCKVLEAMFCKRFIYTFRYRYIIEMDKRLVSLHIDLFL